MAMPTNKTISAEVTYAKSADEQCILAVTLIAPCTILNAITQSGILKRYPEINLTEHKIGVFSQIKKLDDLVREGDRIEIYRPLYQDPKEMRRLRAGKI